MKKREFMIFSILFIILLLSHLIYAQNETLTEEEQAYSCLENKVEDKCDTLTTEEQAFALLALAYDSGLQSECKSALLDNSDNEECWPSSGCKVKDTSLAIIALNHISQDTEDAEDWLLEQKIIPSNLEWYLEIDTDEKSDCEINYDRKDNIKVNEDKKISGSLGASSCFTLAYNNYWLKIKDSCFGKNFTISCDKDFISTLLYKKQNSDVWYVSSNIQSASSGGKTYHNVSSYCFKSGNSCDYEASLWATMALQKTSHDIDGFLPYLIAFSSDNKQKFAETFLYLLTDSDDYLNDIVNLQSTNGYWDIGSGRFYDTALALLSVSGSSQDAFDSAQDWLFENQDSQGCWNNNIRDTGFLLWAGWPKEPASSGGGGVTTCTEADGYCISEAACNETGGDILQYSCSGIGKICCSENEQLDTCEEMNGEICTGGKICTVNTVEAEDTDNCCLGDCITEETECEEFGYSCKSSCNSDEEEAVYDCNSGDVCCKEKEQGSKAWLWILIILIILVIIAIIFKNRVRMWMFKKKSRFKSGTAVKTRPPATPPGAAGMPYAYPPRQIQPLRFIPRAMPKTQQKKTSDREFEETMRKLREISK